MGRWLALCLCVVFAQSAHAQSARALTASVGATSDFVFRGLSYTRGDPAAMASLDLEFPSQLYLGGFVSTANPNPGPRPDVELDLWLGHAFTLSDSLSADLRYTHYLYPNDPRVANYDRDEFTLTFGVRDRLFLAATYSPNTDSVGSAPAAPANQGHSDVWALELSGRGKISTRWSFGLGAGHYALDQLYAENYNYWSATLIGDFAPIELQLAGAGTSEAGGRLFTTDPAGRRAAVTVLYRFMSVR